MTPSTCRCGSPATAARLYPGTANRPICVSCASIDRMTIDPTPERSMPLPDHLIGSRAAAIHPHPTVYNHQALALKILDEGHNVVIATPTASGKTLIFMMHTLYLTEANPGATAMVFYPAKALANDQLTRWQQAAYAANMDPESIQQITGDTPMRQREQLLQRATVALVTPDIVHAWLIRTASSQTQKRFLANLRLAVTDEAHVYEDVLGSNAAFMFRRLDAATNQAQNPHSIQYIAATATIQSPEKHMQNLTGRTFRRVDIEDNGAPTYPTTLLHVPYPQDEKNPEMAASRLLTSVIDNDPAAQVILFHDSRQGAERIASMARKPNQIVPYRAGYLPQERRDIEDKLRSRTIRGVVTTSALEIGIDMPNLNCGINNGLPPTRKQMRQRLGRVGRIGPSTFIILGDANLFRRHSENIKIYYEGTIEESRLYLDNPYIAYQHALCLQRESRNSALPHPTDDRHGPAWPQVFHDILTLAQSPEPPKTLAPARARSIHTPPQLAYSLRSSGEEQLDIVPSIDGSDQENIGTINAPAAIREAFPGALYRHNGRTYRVKEWRRRQGKGYIRILPENEPGTSSTRPIIRRTLLVHPQSVVSGAGTTRPHTGAYATASLQLWTSVEGYIARTTGSTKMVDYLTERDTDNPELTRKAVLMPTSGFLIFINAPWFSPETHDGPGNLSDAAHLLAQDLSYQKSIAIQNIGVATANILIAHAPNEAHLIETAFILYDNVHGGLGLTDPLSTELPQITSRLASAPSPNPAALHQLNAWLTHATDPFQPPPAPDQTAWHRTYQQDAILSYDHPDHGRATARKTGDTWQQGHKITLEDNAGRQITLPAGILDEARATGDWCLWQPSTTRYRQLEAG